MICSPNPGQEEIDNGQLRQSWTSRGRFTPGRCSIWGASVTRPLTCWSGGEVLVVTAATIPARYNAKRAVDTLLAAAIDPDRIRLVVNHIGGKHEMSRADLQNMFGVPVYATVPSDESEVHLACIQKRLPGGQSQMRKAIAEWRER